MSALIVSHDLRLMMLEVAVSNLHVPHTSPFDEVILKKTTLMFRMLDDDWTTLLPHRNDYQRYHGSNHEDEDFHGGRSVVFAVPESALAGPVTDIDVQLCVRKETSKYFEKDTCQIVGFALIKVDDLFNGIVKELLERKELQHCLSPGYLRQYISRSMRGTFSLLDENLQATTATIELYIRITYFGDCIITEMETPETTRAPFYARNDTVPDFLYQFCELSPEELQSGGWDSNVFPPTPEQRSRLVCDCLEYARIKDRLAAINEAYSKFEEDEDEGGLTIGPMADLDKDKRKRKREARMSHAKNLLQEYLKAEAEHWKKLAEMLALFRAAPKGTAPVFTAAKVCPPTPCIPVSCPPCPPC